MGKTLIKTHNFQAKINIYMNIHILGTLSKLVFLTKEGKRYIYINSIRKQTIKKHKNYTAQTLNFHLLTCIIFTTHIH